MTLIWHIIRKDLRRDKWPLLLWLVIGLGQTGIGLAFLSEDGTDFPAIDLLRLNSLLLLIVFHVMGYLLALRWVQADEVAGTRMFWVTRPISGGRLFAAKATGLLAVFGVLPVLLWLPWWLHCGIGVRDMAWLAAETFGWQLLLIAPALLIGSLTEDHGRAIMWSLLLCAGWLAWSAFGQATLASVDFRQFSRGFFGVWFSRLWVAGLLLVVGFVAIAAGQFVARDTWRSLVRITILALLVILVGRLWVIDFSEELARLAQAGDFKTDTGVADSMTFSPSKARVSGFRDYRLVLGKREEERSLIVSVHVDGLPAGFALEGEHTFRKLIFADGTTAYDASRPRFGTVWGPIIRQRLALPEPAADAETIRWGRARLAKTNADRVARGLPPLEDHWEARSEPAVERPTLPLVFPVSVPTLQRIREHPPGYVTRLEGRVVCPEIVQQLPLQPGERGAGVAQPLRVTSVDDRVVKLTETTPAFLTEGWFFSRGGNRQSARRLPGPHLYSVNRVTGDLDSMSRRVLVPTAITVGGVAIAWTETHVYPGRWVRNGAWVTKDPDWQKHTEIVVLRERPVGQFVREIRTDRLEIQWPLDEPNGGAATLVQAGN